MSDLNVRHNRVVWFDIPVVDLDRAIAFYSTVLGVKVSKERFGDTAFGVIDHDEGNGGCLVPGTGGVSATHGVLIYLNVEGRLRTAVAEVEPMGGRIVQPVHSIGAHGLRAIVLDSEGNRIALHASTDS